MLELRKFKAGYGAKSLLALDALELAPGRITTVLGRNGSGKSTLLRAIVGIVPYEGVVKLDGVELRTLSRPERARRIAYLPQTLPVPELDLYTLVSHGRFSRLGFSRRLGERDRTAIRSAMEAADVWPLRHRRAGDISGGERQRAYLAMVIAQDADFLLLDEPEASMDVAHQLKLAELFRELAARGKGIVVSSHDLPLSFAVSNRIVLLAEGGTAAEGTPEELIGMQEVMRRAMGASLVPARNGGGLFPYVIAK